MLNKFLKTFGFLVLGYLHIMIFIFSIIPLLIIREEFGLIGYIIGSIVYIFIFWHVINGNIKFR